MLSVASGQSEAASRGAKRVKVFQPATLVREGATLRIHLLDVSATGALAHAQEPPPARSQVEVRCADLVRTASVRWSEGKRFGLLFDRPLLDADLDAIAARRSVALSPPAAA
jgi:hypothetical protein